LGNGSRAAEAFAYQWPLASVRSEEGMGRVTEALAVEAESGLCDVAYIHEPYWDIDHGD
jgi:hypothetical protein